MSADYSRDLIGYAGNPPHPHWPGNARIALSFVLNYEEGGERCVLHGDKESEAFLSEMVAAQPLQGARNMSMESLYEYGSRAGVWRLLKLFKQHDIPLTIFAVAMAAQRHPQVIKAMVAEGHEICSHGYRWIDYQYMDEAQEREHMLEAIRILTELTGERPLGWYTGRTGPNTRRLVREEGGFLYDSDTYDDDLPYWLDHDGHGNAISPQLVIPYTLDANDMRFATAQGFNSGDQFLAYLKDAFDTLYAEGRAGRPAMMSIGLHCRLIGRPGRAAALQRFIDHVKGHERVWLPTRGEIAAHWRERHPYRAPALRPSRMGKDGFVEKFGGIFEHSPWIAERAFSLELGPAHDSAGGLHNALCRVFRSASEEERLGVLRAHPDLAGKLAQAKRLTAESTAEQASAGLDALTDAERETFTRLNAAYVEKFGFPFIVAVKDNTRASILAAFHARIDNDRAAEFTTACRQVERIAELRLQAILPA